MAQEMVSSSCRQAKRVLLGLAACELIPGLLTVSFVLVIPAVVALILSLFHKRPHAFSPPPLIPPPRLIS